MGNEGAELNQAKQQLNVEKCPRDHATKVEENTTSKYDVDQELNNVKKSLENATQELKIKDETIQSLKCEVDKLKELKELKSLLSEKDTMLHSIKKELNVVQASMARTKLALCDNKKRVEELHAEVERRKESELKLHDSFLAQSNQLEEMSEVVEKYKLEVVTIREKMKSKQEDGERDTSGDDSDEENDSDDSNRSDVKGLVDEITVLKKELVRAMEAEENSKKAMDDLALVLKEVVSESQKTKDKLQYTEEQLEDAVKDQVENLKRIVKSTEQNYETMLKDLRKENDQLKNRVNRLKKEEEEFFLAWNEKEIEFVDCIKTTETEKDAAQEHNRKLMELLRGTKEISVDSKEETRKLREMLGQALDEANMAKEAANIAEEEANIAKEENSYMKVSLAEKDTTLVSLAREAERLRINETESTESIKELKRIIVSGSKKEIEKEKKDLRKASKRSDSISDNNEKEATTTTKERRTSGSLSFDLNQLWPVTTTKTSKEGEEEHHEKADELSGSIFDLVESPAAAQEPPANGHHRRTSSAFTDDGKVIFEHFEEGDHFDDMEMDRHSHGKRKALLKRFSDLLKRKNYHPPHHHKDSPKEVQPPPPKEISMI